MPNLNVDNIVDASQSSIDVKDATDYNNNRQQYMQKVASKLRYGGKISFCGHDLIEISRGVVTRQLSLGEASEMLYDKDKVSLSSASVMVKQLESLGLNVLKARVNNYKYFIEAERQSL